MPIINLRTELYPDSVNRERSFTPPEYPPNNTVNRTRKTCLKGLKKHSKINRQ